jgi:uncharacterized membrane protein YtjA (UPF0391 family)
MAAFFFSVPEQSGMSHVSFSSFQGRLVMLYWALVFLVVAIIAGALGFGGIAGTSAGIAQILFFVFLAFLVISLVAGLFRRA